MKRPGQPKRRHGLRSSRALVSSGVATTQGRIRRKPRTPTEFARIYGSKKRVAWVKAQWCIVPFCTASECENAHTQSGGVGRKANAETIVPLCRAHHTELHNTGQRSFAAKYGLNLGSQAIRINALWQRMQEPVRMWTELPHVGLTQERQA